MFILLILLIKILFITDYKLKLVILIVVDAQMQLSVLDVLVMIQPKKIQHYRVFVSPQLGIMQELALVL
jgi:hypothetical protein